MERCEGDQQMRAATVVMIAILVCGFGTGPALSQTSDRWLFSLHMYDTLTGWARGAEGYGGVGAKGAVSSIVRTADGGIHWRDVTPRPPVGQQLYRYAFDVGWLSALSAWMWTTMGPRDAEPSSLRTAVLFVTIDGGNTWKQMTLPSYGRIDFLDTRNGWLVGDDDAVYRSTDGGETWVKIGNAKFFHRTVGIKFLNTMTGWSAGVGDAKNGIYLLVTHDGGHIWQQQRLPLPFQIASPAYLDVAGSPRFFNSHDGIVTAVYGTKESAGVFLYVTRDSGTTWTHTTPVAVQSYRTVSGNLSPNYRSSSFADASHGWVTDGDALYVTTDGGRRWTRMQTGVAPALGPLGQLDFISPSVGWATGQALFSPFLMRTLDGGRTWTAVSYTVSRR